MSRWLQTPMGSYVLEWEQACLDEAVVDAFGYHALQLGLPQLHGLRENRMPHRWMAVRSLDRGLESSHPPDTVLQCDFDALPFPSHSLDLIALPHALELTHDPHLTLSEAERVLVPEGRLMILGFNPHSLWGWSGRLPVPGALAYRRVRDWLRLLSFEVEDARFGCWRPAVSSPQWLERLRGFDTVGERWWPVLGGVYFITAVKRVRGMRLVGLARRQSKQRASRATVATSIQGHTPSPRWVDSDVGSAR
jgi:SAM-dependent methyltransferase